MKKPVFDPLDLDLLDPVAAYDQVEPFFADMALRKKLYLERIDRLTIASIPAGSRSLLDVGAGDGKRALQIAAKAGLEQVVLLEPSAEMMKDSSDLATVWKLRVEELYKEGSIGTGRQFDVITCLWNVLGHIRTAETRVQVLRQLARMLTPQGVLVLDVNHRYNIRSYGLLRTMERFLRDQFLPAESNGDVTVTWTLGRDHCRTFGHVFTNREVGQLASDAGLVVEEKVVVDYNTGAVRRFGFEGNLFYVFRRRNSVSNSSNLSQTSSTSVAVI